MALTSGARLGPYAIVSPIGAGGMGEVYQATDTRLDRTVAIKVLPEHLAESPERKARFEREAKAISQLNHPHICTLHDIGEEDGVDFLVMEYIEGETLAERLKQGALKLDEALEYGIQIAGGLDAAHRAGIVHRDLKPGNVMLTKSGIKLLDFGLARLTINDPASDASDAPTQQKDLTEEQAVVGTLPYMAPEQLEGTRADHRADTWAFGALFYEMVSGRRPFAGGSQASLIGSILKDTPPPLAGKRPFVPARLDALLRRCLDKDPERRWQSAKDLAWELEEISRAGEGVEERAKSGARSWAWVGALLATAAWTALVVRVSSTGGGGSVDRPEVGLRQITGRPETATLHSAALSPDGESLAFATETGLFLQLVATGEEQQIPLPEAFQIHEVDWLGDSSTLLFSAASGGRIGLYRTSIFGGTPRKLSEDDAWRAAVSPDGARIAYLQNLPANVVRVMDADGGNARTLAAVEGDDSFWEIAWSPDARWLLVGRWGGSVTPFDTVLEAIDVDTGGVHTVISDPRFFQNWRGFLPFAWAPDGRLILARRELEPNHLSSNLWWLEIDPATASLRGELARLTELVGLNFKDLSMTAAGSSVAFLLERNQSDVTVAHLSPDGTLGDVLPVTTDERDDRALGWSPDWSTIFFESARSGSFDLFRARADAPGRAQFLARKGPSAAFLATSPDGSTVTYWDGSELKRVPASGGPAETILSAGVWPGHSCSRAPYRCLLGERSADGSHYTLFELDWERGKGEEVLRFSNESTFTSWALSPDGTKVVVGGADARLRIFDLETKAETVFQIDGWHYGEFPAWAADGRGIFVEGGPTSRRYFRKGLLYISLEGEVRSLRQNWNEWITHVLAETGDNRIAFSSQRFTGNVWMIEGL